MEVLEEAEEPTVEATAAAMVEAMAVAMVEAEVEAVAEEPTVEATAAAMVEAMAVAMAVDMVEATVEVMVVTTEEDFQVTYIDLNFNNFQTIEPACAEILGQSSAHSLATGPLTTDPFISPFAFTMTPALSSK